MSGRFARSARSAVAAGAVVLVALTLAAVVVVRTGRFDGWLTTRIAALLGSRVRFTAAHAVWWPQPGVALDDVALAVGTADDVASAATVTCRVRLPALLEGRVVIANVRIDGLRVTVERGADGSLRAGGLDLLAAQAASADGVGDRQRLPALRVRRGEVVYRAEGGPPPLHLTDVDASFAPRGRGARIELTGRLDPAASVRARLDLDALAPLAEIPFEAQIDGEDVDAATAFGWLASGIPELAARGRLRLSAALSGRGTATSDGTVSVELTDGALSLADWQASSPLRVAARATWNGTDLALADGRLAAARIAGRALDADTIEASFAYADRTLQVSAAQLRVYGGTWRSSGSVQPAAPPAIDATVRGDGIEGAQLATALDALGVSGPLPQVDAPLTMTASARGTPGGAWNGSAAIESSGAVHWQGVQAGAPLALRGDVHIEPAPDGGQPVLSLSNGHVRVGTAAFGTVSAAAIAAEFGVAGGAVQVTSLQAAALGGSWTYHGSLPVAANARWSGELAARRVSTAALSSALGDGGSADGSLDLSARLTGSGTHRVTGTARVTLASGALSVDELRVDAPAEASAALRVDGAQVALSDGRARAARLRVRDVQASDLATGFGYGRDGLRLSALQARAFAGTWQADGTLALSDPPRWNGTVAAKQVDFDAVLASVADGDADAPYSIGGIADLELRLSADGGGSAQGTAEVRLASGTFILDPLEVGGPAHAKGTFSVQGNTLSLSDVSAEAAHAAYGPLSGTDATARFQLAADRLSFSDLRFQSCAGNWTHTGWYSLDAGGHFAGQLGIENARPHDLLTMLGTSPADLDFARLDLDSEFHGRATDDWLATVRATGAAWLYDGSMRSTIVLQAIWQAIAGARHGERFMRALDRRTRVADIGGSFELRRSMLSTPDFALTTDDYNATAVGTIGLDGSLDLRTRIELTSRGVQHMLVLGSVPLPTESLPALPPIPATVTGTLTNPVVRPNVAALPAATVRWLVTALLDTPRSLGESVVHRLGQLWSGLKRVGGGESEQSTEPAE